HTTFSDGESAPPSVVKACAAAGCKEIAITDHVDQHGNFAFVPEFRKASSLRSYIQAIEELGDHALDELGVAVHVGIELCTTSHEYKAAFRDHVAPLCDQLELILIEGRDDAGPVDVAIATRGLLRDVGISIPVVISHPEFGEIAERIESLVANDIGLELNEAKLSPAHKQGLDLVLGAAREQGIPMPRFTLGSDAHAAADAGKLPIVHRHATALGLASRLIWL
ncbi:MAG: PHP domain-containing protein, partial [Candidatus Lokiarchaeota archaeon]|nr:PHP domain-containing protein [Candidatus Lokiarchaeota archaeon]